MYYASKYGDFVDARNERNEKARYPERNRTVEDLLKNKKTCPEESIYQIGTMEDHVSGDVLLAIVNDFFGEMERRFGSHVRILDWALHLDEGTPHIQERHVFECKNKYGELCPQQEKALEELEIPLPNPDKPKGKHNNRKQTFDAICRELLFEICEKHGLHLDREPEYGGRTYLEKQNFILAKQKEMLPQQEQALQEVTLKLEDAESLVEEITEKAYEKGCEVVTDTVREETQKQDIAEISKFQKWATVPERNYSQQKKDIINECLSKTKNVLLDAAKNMLEKIQTYYTTRKSNRQTRSKSRKRPENLCCFVCSNTKSKSKAKIRQGKRQENRIWNGKRHLIVEHQVPFLFGMNVFEVVKQSVTTRQVAEYYSLSVNRFDKATCHFHQDRVPSMKVDKRFHCFDCSADGDVIDFVAKLYGIDAKDAAVKLAEDFHIAYGCYSKGMKCKQLAKQKN